MDRLRIALLLAVLVGAGCSEPCRTEAPAFLVEVPCPSTVDGSAVEALWSESVIKGGGVQREQKTRLLADGRLAGGEMSYRVEAGVSGVGGFEVELRVAGIDRAGQPLFSYRRSFSASGDGCNRVRLGAADLAACDCLIADTCYQAGEEKRGDLCQKCEPRRSAIAWSLQPSCVSTLAGTGTAGFGPAEGRATSTPLNAPTGVAVAPSGKLYVADSCNNRIREVDPSSGPPSLRSVAGGDLGSPCAPSLVSSAATHKDGPGAEARLYSPYDLVAEPERLIVADMNNHMIREVAIGGAWNVGTLAGTLWSTPPVKSCVDMEPGTEKLLLPTSVAVDAGLVYFIDSGNSCIRRLDRTRVTAFYGGAASAEPLSFPMDLAIDHQHRKLYVSDRAAHRLVRLDLDTATVDASFGQKGSPGWSDGKAGEVKLCQPTGLALDEVGGKLYLADSGNQAIRAIWTATGEVQTLNRSGHRPCLPDGAGRLPCDAGRSSDAVTGGFADGPLASARFNCPSGIAFDERRHALFVADVRNDRVRMIALP